MVYVDVGGHIVADTLVELHQFAIMLDIGRHWFHNPRHRYHPHYDLPKSLLVDDAIIAGARLVTAREIAQLSKEMK